MTTYLVDGKKPGQFKARCNLAKPHPIRDLPEYLRREYAEKGWPKGFRATYDRKSRRDVNRECFLEPLCQGFETTDPVAFVEHMKTVHGKREVKGYSETWAAGIRKGWRAPRLKPDGQPLVKDVVSLVETCPSCGLVAEVGHRAADVLWWDKHLRGCEPAKAAS